MNDLLDVADRIVGQARPGEAVEAYGIDSTTTAVKARGGAVESFSSARTRGVGVRVVAGDRVGYAYTADLEAVALDDALAEARANAEVAGPDPANVLPAPAATSAARLQLYEPAFGAVSAADKVAAALRLDGLVAGVDPRVRGVDVASYGDDDRTVAIASTQGVRGTYRRADAYAFVEVLAQDAGSTASAYGLTTGRTLAALDLEAAAEEGVARAVRMLGARKPPSGRLPVLLDPFATASLLGVLAQALSAEAALKGRSVFADLAGERVGAPGVTLVDDGRLPDGPATAPWDDEGTPTGRTALLDDGVLTGFLHNAWTAARGGTASTGNAGRSGFKSSPGVVPTNLFFAPGDQTPAQLYARAGTGFLCTRVLGVHSGANPVSGDFSVGAAGLMIRDGQPAEAVREATIAGTLPHMLAGLTAVADDLRFLPFGGGMGGATVLIEGMTLAGA